MVFILHNKKLKLLNNKLELVGIETVVNTVNYTLSQLATGMIGQSNMVHLGGENVARNKYYTSSPKARRSIGGGVHNYIGPCDPSGVIPPGTPISVWGTQNPNIPNDHPSGDPIIQFANATVANSNLSLLTYEFAQSGSSIEMWMQDATGSNCWLTYANAVNADPIGLNSVVYYQGEDNMGTSKASYKTSLRKLHTQHLVLTGNVATPEKFYFGLVIVGPNYGYSQGVNDASQIRQAQLEYIAENVGAYMVTSAADMNLNAGSNPQDGDGVIHIGYDSETTLGLRYAKSLRLFAAGTPVKFPGPKISSWNISGTKATINTTGGVGALQRAAAGNGLIGGFRFFDSGGTLIPYTTAAFGANNTIVLTLASAGAVSMDFCMANAPFGNLTDQSAVVVDSDTTPFPLIPCGPMPVLPVS